MGMFREKESCMPCPPGTFQENSNKLFCTPCPAGTHRATTGAVSLAQCIRCPRNSFSSSGSAKCTTCRPGSLALPGSDQCGACGSGFELKAIGGPCQPCQAGFFSRKAHPGTELCSRCPDGTFSSQPGASSCALCPRGTFRRNTPTVHGIQDFGEDSSFCPFCEAGTYSDSEGSIVCKLCPPGTFSKNGATSCSPCPRGKFSTFIGSSRCLKCPSGSSSVGIRPAGCNHQDKGCSPETFESVDGECQSCLPGFFLHVKRRSCVPCPDSYVSRGGIQSKCTRCPPGKVPLGDESIFEKSACECAPGTMDNGNGGCVACPSGFFWNRPSYNKILTRNLARTRMAHPGTCSPCPTGFFSKQSGRTECELCPLNTFQDELGATSCKQCPKDSRSPIGNMSSGSTFPSHISCEVDETGCAPGQVRDATGSCCWKTCPLSGTFFNGSDCIRCPSGSVYIKRKRVCKACDSNYTSRGSFSRKCKRCPDNTNRSIFVQRRCMCRNLSYSGPSYGVHNGKCVVCPPGYANVIPSAVETFCGKCPPGSISSKPGTYYCYPCGPHSITRGDDRTKCFPCRAGTKRPRDIFGLLLNECRTGSK